MAVQRLCFIKFLGYLLVLQCCKARPTGNNNNKMTMSGEPTHFQVDDKAAELEINANAMGVKVNAKPASLQVVSKPGAPAIAVPHPAVVIPQLPTPYFTAPFYPSPMVVGHRRTVRRRHHFFDNPSIGNWNFKKEKIPRKATSKTSNISEKEEHSIQIFKKSEISKKSKNSQKSPRKRQWIQRIPVLAPIVYNPGTNIRVHPLVQRLFDASQAAMRSSVPRPIYGFSLQTISPWNQQFSYISPGYSRETGETGGLARGSIHRVIYLPAQPGYQAMQAMSPLVASTGQPWSSPGMLHGPIPGYNGYYDPILTRDFIPDFNTPALPRVQVPTARALIPNETPGGFMYPGYTPLGSLQILSKRLTIPHSSGSKHNNAKEVETNTQKKSTSEISISGKATSEKNTAGGNNARAKRSAVGTGENKLAINHDSNHHGKKNSKRQFILTQPVFEPVQQPVVAYVPMLTSPPLQAPTVTSPLARDFVLRLPESTPGTFVLNVPSIQQTPQISTLPFGGLEPSHLYNSRQYNVLPENQPNYVATATQRSGINQQAWRRSFGIAQGSNSAPLAELTGIMGSPIVRHGPHVTMFYNGELPSHVQDEIFRESPLQSRGRIPGKKYQSVDEDDDQSDYQSDSEYTTDTYDDLPSSERIEDNGSYTERVLPDGRTVFRKDHVGFGPITVEANTAESALRHNEDAIDMNLDSDKRKQIPRPGNERSAIDRRIEIPTPKTI